MPVPDAVAYQVHVGPLLTKLVSRPEIPKPLRKCQWRILTVVYELVPDNHFREHDISRVTNITLPGDSSDMTQDVPKARLLRCILVLEFPNVVARKECLNLRVEVKFREPVWESGDVAPIGKVVH